MALWFKGIDWDKVAESKYDYIIDNTYEQKYYIYHNKLTKKYSCINKFGKPMVMFESEPSQLMTSKYYEYIKNGSWSIVYKEAAEEYVERNVTL